MSLWEPGGARWGAVATSPLQIGHDTASHGAADPFGAAESATVAYAYTAHKNGATSVATP